MKEIGEKLKETRENIGISIEEAAEDLKTRPTQIENIESVEPMTHTLDEFVFELREDEAETSEDIEDILRNSDEHTEREIEVPKVVG